MGKPVMYHVTLCEEVNLVKPAQLPSSFVIGIDSWVSFVNTSKDTFLKIMNGRGRSVLIIEIYTVFKIFSKFKNEKTP